MESDAIRDNAERHRFEVVVDGHLARAEYAVSGDVITFTHTIVPPALEGRGIASRLIRHALSEARARGLRVVPQCPFVAAYIRKHPEWADLLVEPLD
ncbi:MULTISPECIES: GNAT family N-acetyltransferase [unclassified Sphingomonas]|uniref:GNAT family N-acetyltransferase n=1 Tax=unclassified Sphingomonas TaxID=196159 RepID=UPI00083666A3|nr:MULTISPECIES: GNAT family N-acetyltransferase [unclassified Sphingomonas]